MTTAEIDNQGFIPVAGGVKNGMTIIALRKKNCLKKWITWNHGKDNFVDPVILDDRQKKILRKVIK